MIFGHLTNNIKY